MLESMRGLLRCWVSTLIRMMGKSTESEGIVLFLLDEASGARIITSLRRRLFAVVAAASGCCWSTRAMLKSRRRSHKSRR